MREQFNSELERIEKISKYATGRASGMLDDLATAYISASEFGHLDKSLISIRTAKKHMRAQGHTKEQINDYFLERSYLSKTTLRQITTDSIYNADNSLKPIIENLTINNYNENVTDIIIDKLKSEPVLLSALRRGVSEAHLRQNLKIKNATLLKNFYEKHKDII